MTSPSTTPTVSVDQSIPSGPDIQIDHAEHRTNRIKLAAMTSVASKVVTALVLIVGTPFITRALGSEKYGVYGAVAASVGWIIMVQFGIGPSLTLGIARASASGDREQEAKYFTSALFMIAAIAAVVSAVALVGIFLVPTDAIFGHRFDAYSSELRRDMIVLVAFIIARLILNVFDAAQAGYQETYICNLWATLGGSLSLIALFLAGAYFPTIIGLIIALYGLPILADTINGIRLIGSSHKNLMPSLKYFDIALSKSLLKDGAAFTMVTLSSFLVYQLSVLIAGRYGGPHSAGVFTAMNIVMSSALGVVVMCVQPLWSALTDAITRHDFAWARIACARILVMAMAYAITVGVVLCLAGHQIIDLWQGHRISISIPMQIAYGLYFILAVWEYTHYNILIGLGSIMNSAVVMLVRSIVMVISSQILVGYFGIVGIAFALCLAQICVSAWIFPILLNRQLKSVLVRNTL